MNTLSKLEKSKSFWTILIISVAFFLLRMPSLFEPYWYGDEGIYEVIGQALHQGRILYTDIWDNKPPLLYVIFALFNGNQESVRTLSLIFGVLSTIVFFYLSKKIFKKLSSSILATLLFTILFGTPFLEGNIANAENFMLLPIITAGLLLYKISENPRSEIRNPKHIQNNKTFKTYFSSFTSHLSTPFIAGLLLGIAFLFKTVAIFDLAAFLLFLMLVSKKHFSPLTAQFSTLFLGFLIPFFLTALYFLFNNSLTAFIQAAFFGNIDYVGLNNTFFNIPQGLILFKLLLLAIAVGLIFFKRHTFSKATLFILLWLTFSLFNAFFSQRPYTHYLLVLLPSICLFIGLVVETANKKLQLLFIVFLIAICLVIKANFWLSSVEKTVLYYQNMVLFITGQKDVQSYRSFFDSRTPRDYDLASFITNHTEAYDDVFIWGDSAQIYALSQKLPINKYTTAYHVIPNEQALEETQKRLLEVKPKYIITLVETPPLPFSVPFYSVRYTNTGATVYERNF